MQESHYLTCADCGQENGADSKFCRACGSALAPGAPVPLTCASCGLENDADSKFCRNCGRALVTEVAVPAAGAPLTSLACPRCQQGNEPGSEFCYNCGLPLAGEGGRASTARPSLQAFASGRPAGFWIRAAGLFCDSFIGHVLLGLALPLLTDSSLAEYYSDFSSSTGLVGYAIHFTYHTALVGAFATTMGKRPFNLYIVRPDGTRVGYGRALYREFAKYVSQLLLGIGYFMVLFRADKRALHDLIADTVVIRR